MIKRMVALLQMPVEVMVTCPIVREEGGLAMSSRNVHLTAADHTHALVLSRALTLIKEQHPYHTIAELKQLAGDLIDSEPGVALDYFEIADGDTLLPANPATQKIVALVAAKVGNTRLIDNIVLT